MKLILLTNMPAYQQIELAKAFVTELGEHNFRIGVLASLSEDRQKMGWQDDYDQTYVLRFDRSDEDKKAILEWIESADVVIQGRFPIHYVRSRINRGGLTYAYQERVWKKGFTAVRFISRLGFLIKNYYSVNKPNYHLLAAGRYAAEDLLRLGVFKSRAWKFGYFVESNTNPQPKSNQAPVKLIWCGRFMPLKRPERAIELLQAFVDQGTDAHLTMIGGGELEAQLRERVQANGFTSMVTFTGWQSVEQVNQAMRGAHIMLMSSDHREGWGVVINEAINNACYPMVCDEVGSARWLIKDGVTGTVYQDKNFHIQAQALAKKWSAAPERIKLMGIDGQQRLRSDWSTQAAATRVIQHAERLLSTKPVSDLFEGGPCSPAVITKQ